MEAVSLFTCHVGNHPDFAWSAILAADEQQLQKVGAGPHAFSFFICFLFSSDGVTIPPVSLP